MLKGKLCTVRHLLTADLNTFNQDVKVYRLLRQEWEALSLQNRRPL
ncbi:MAG: hypothetical protein K2X55_03765 [Burkholderiaceae bacterium]|nr:hypothetical protein [Burkholderiaceae bacterium]